VRPTTGQVLLTFTSVSFANYRLVLVLLLPEPPMLEYSFQARNLFSCLFSGCSRLEKTIPTLEPHVGRNLYIRSPDTHDQQTEPRRPNAFRRGTRTYRGRITHDRHRCTAQCRHVDVLCDNSFGCGNGRIGLRLTSPLSKERSHLRLDINQESQLLCRSPLLYHT